MRSGPIPGSSFYLEKTEVTLGRDLANDIPVPDQEISRRHVPEWCPHQFTPTPQ